MKRGLIAPYQWDDSDRSPESLMAMADVLLGRADAYLQSTLADTDHLDTKALHLTVGDIAVFAFLVTFKQSLLWAIPELFSDDGAGRLLSRLQAARLGVGAGSRELLAA